MKILTSPNHAARNVHSLTHLWNMSWLIIRVAVNLNLGHISDWTKPFMFQSLILSCFYRNQILYCIHIYCCGHYLFIYIFCLVTVSFFLLLSMPSGPAWQWWNTMHHSVCQLYICYKLLTYKLTCRSKHFIICFWDSEKYCSSKVYIINHAWVELHTTTLPSHYFVSVF